MMGSAGGGVSDGVSGGGSSGGSGFIESFVAAARMMADVLEYAQVHQQGHLQ